MSRPSRVAPQSVSRIFWLPMLLALGSLAGLVLGLTGDGWRDAVSALLLLLPLAAFVYSWRRRA